MVGEPIEESSGAFKAAPVRSVPWVLQGTDMLPTPRPKFQPHVLDRHV